MKTGKKKKMIENVKYPIDRRLIINPNFPR